MREHIVKKENYEKEPAAATPPAAEPTAAATTAEHSVYYNMEGATSKAAPAVPPSTSLAAGQPWKEKAAAASAAWVAIDEQEEPRGARKRKRQCEQKVNDKVLG